MFHIYDVKNSVTTHQHDITGATGGGSPRNAEESIYAPQ